MINPQKARLLRVPAGLRWPTVNSGCAHTDPLSSITITRSAIRYLTRSRARPRRGKTRRRRRIAVFVLTLALALLAMTAAVTTTTVATASASSPDDLASAPITAPGGAPTAPGDDPGGAPGGVPAVAPFGSEASALPAALGSGRSIPPASGPVASPIAGPRAASATGSLALPVNGLVAGSASPPGKPGSSDPANPSPGRPILAGPANASPGESAPADPPGVTGPTGHFSWPLSPPHPVLRPFQAPATPYGPGHRGVDLGGSVGEPVFAAGDGLVLYAGSLFNCGLISIEHPGGLRTTYTPVVPSVRVGQEVARRQQIGTLLAAQPGCPEEVGNNGTGPPVFLYWGVHRDRTYLDPLRLVETGEIRLLPWPGDGQ
ncbi:MAG TPA: peptidoglycan DD-metalloendopeptidase family protein [Pseudonocardiaceae bacterium]